MFGADMSESILNWETKKETKAPEYEEPDDECTFDGYIYWDKHGRPLKPKLEHIYTDGVKTDYQKLIDDHAAEMSKSVLYLWEHSDENYNDNDSSME